jgi:hypothetical protein
VIIPLGPPFRTGSSDLPGDAGPFEPRERASLASPYLVLLRVGFDLPTPLPGFAVRSYRTFSPLPRFPSGSHGGLFSVPLSFGLPRPEFLRHAARGSPDFPPSLRQKAFETAITCPARVDMEDSAVPVSRS